MSDVLPLTDKELALFHNIDFGEAQNAVNSLMRTIAALKVERDNFRAQLSTVRGGLGPKNNGRGDDLSYDLPTALRVEQAELAVARAL